VDTGLFSRGLLCFLETGTRLRASVIVFTLLAAFLALAKLSFFVVAAVSAALLAADMVVRRRPSLALMLIAGFIGAVLLGWVMTHQSLSNLGVSLANAITVIQSYNQALGLEGLPALTNRGVMLGVLVGFTMLLRGGSAFMHEAHAGWRRGLFLAWAGFLALANWKHGFVHLDACHALWSVAFVPVFALGLETLPASWRPAQRGARVLALLCTAVAVLTLQGLLFRSISQSLTQPLVNFKYHLQCLTHPGEYERRMKEEVRILEANAQLPALRALIGRAPVDVFGQFQVDALYNGLNYVPRPAFQSYAACNPALMRLNEDFYLGKTSPALVLFNLKAMDGRFPPLEDAQVLRHLLINYEFLAEEGRFLLLRAKSNDAARLVLRAEGSVRAGQPIDLRGFAAANLWLELDLRPTLAGWLRQLVYRPSTVRLAAWREPGSGLILRRRAPAAMLEAGFVASPLLRNNQDVKAWYQRTASTRPGACSVEMLPSDRYLWREQIHFRVYEIANPLQAAPSVPPEQLTREGSPPADRALAAPAGAARFNLFRNRRWKPNLPEPGNPAEIATYLALALMPLVSGALLFLFARQRRNQAHPAGAGALILGNSLLLLFLLSVGLLAGETWFRFFYDTTDSLGTTRVCERWVQRHWRTNQAGCRDDIEYVPALQPGRRRVSFLGDSFTAGHGIKEVADRFSNRLRRTRPEWEVHVLAGVGLDTGGELALMKKAFNRGYQVNDVVLVYCLNDLGDLLTEQGQAFSGVFDQMELNPWFARHSYFVNLFYSRFQAARNPFVRDYFSFVQHGYRGPIWERQKQRLTELRDLVQAHGGRLWVVTFPFLHTLQPDEGNRYAHEELGRFWRTLGVPHLDLLPIYKNLRPEQLTVNRYDAHPNERAHRMAAQAIGRFLTEDPSR
jgi:hypothetical protein